MRPNEVLEALTKLHETFNSFSKQVTDRSKTIEIVKDKIRLEESCLKLASLRMGHLKKKLVLIQELINLMGSETAKVQDLEKRVNEQKDTLLQLTESIQKMDQTHNEQMESRKATMSKYKKTTSERLKAAVKKRWDAEADRVRQLNLTKTTLEEKMKNLKRELENKMFEHRRKEDEFDMDLLKKQSKMEMETRAKIEQLRKKKAALERQYHARLQQIQVQAEVRIKKLQDQYAALCQDYSDTHGSIPANRQPTPRKGIKRKSTGHPYLTDYTE